MYYTNLPCYFNRVSPPLVLPDSRLKRTVGALQTEQGFGVPLFCANCGKGPFGYVAEENITFAFYLCEPCAEKHGHIDGTYVEPDVVFFERLAAAQQEKHGRAITLPEFVEQLKDEHSVESKLLRDWKFRRAA